MQTLILLLNVLIQFFIYIVIAWSLLSFFLSPYHPVREALGRIVEPFLNPIRRVIPPAGMMDFSPLILILLVDAFRRILNVVLINLS